MKNHKVKVNTYWRKPYKVYQYKTRWQAFIHRVKVFFKVLFWGMIIASILVGIYEAGNYFGDEKIIYTKQEVIKEVEIKATIMDKIAGCESQGSAKLKGTHWDKNGQVLMRSNTNRTVDLGKYQINTVWFAKATELGYDLTLEKDNEAMAMWIYKNRGTGDWESSKHCWNR